MDNKLPTFSVYAVSLINDPEMLYLWSTQELAQKFINEKIKDSKGTFRKDNFKISPLKINDGSENCL